MKRKVITTAIYYRKPTKEEIAAGARKSERFYILVPMKDVFLGTDEFAGPIFKPSVKWQDGLRYYFKCVNYVENL